MNRKHRQILKLENNLFQLQGARQVIANSHFVKEEIIREFKYPPERISVVHNGLPDTQFKTKPGLCSETRSSWGLRDDELAIVFVGADWGRKGLQYAIQAVNRINQAKVRLIVAGAGKKGLSSSKCVQFLGSVQDMASVYASVDLFILPTIYDAFSNACLEALSFGLPVITTPTNGFTEIMTPGVHGEIVRGPDDVEGLTSAILAWKDPQKRATARAACIELARSHTMERNVTETLRVLEKLSR